MRTTTPRSTRLSGTLILLGACALLVAGAPPLAARGTRPEFLNSGKVLPKAIAT